MFFQNRRTTTETQLQVQVLTIGILMGIAFAAPPGAVTAETFRRGVRGGFGLALGVQLGSLLGDAAYAALALAGLAVVAQNPTVQLALGAAGAMFLIYLAWSSLQAAARPVLLTTNGELDVERRGAFLSGLALSLTNPWAVAFWLSLGGVLASLGLVGASALQIALFFGCFMLGSAIWAVILSYAIAYVRRWVRPAVFRAVSLACGLALGAFGLAAAGRVIFSFIG